MVGGEKGRNETEWNIKATLLGRAQDQTSTIIAHNTARIYVMYKTLESSAP